MSKFIIKQLVTSAIILLTANASAHDISYCKGTHVTKSMNKALQSVIKQFAAENSCHIGKNCIRNFETIKYSIAWSKPCLKSAAKYNDPKGSTFICEKGLCVPYGFNWPVANYIKK